MRILRSSDHGIVFLGFTVLMLFSKHRIIYDLLFFRWHVSIIIDGAETLSVPEAVDHVILCLAFIVLFVDLAYCGFILVISCRVAYQFSLCGVSTNCACSSFFCGVFPVSPASVTSSLLMTVQSFNASSAPF